MLKPYNEMLEVEVERYLEVVIFFVKQRSG